MRIPGFPKFIREEESQDHRLKDCPLVLDAHSFFYRTYEDSKLPFIFGAEANELARFLNGRKLSRFRKSNIKCYFIFKGGDSDIERKIQRTQSTDFDLETNKFVAPVFLREMFLQVIDEMGFAYSTSVTESKDDCVALTIELQCSLMSYNSEYFFMNAPVTSWLKYVYTDNYILSSQYQLRDFLDKHSITNKKAAILAALTDVHTFPPEHFNDLLQKWVVFDDDSNTKFKNLLKWLATHNEDEILNEVTAFLSESTEIQKFNSRTEQILTNLPKDHGSVVTEYLMNDCKISVSCRDPLWFEKGVAAQYIAIPYINLYKHKYIQGSCAVENNKLTDSLMLSIDIIKYAYNLLTNFKANQIRVYQDSENYITVNTEDSIQKPMYRCHESVFENGWQNINSLKLFHHFLAENDINIDILHQFPDDSIMLFITLIYFARKKIAEEIDVTKEIYCFIISYVMLYAVLHNSDYYLERYRGLRKEDAEEARRATEKYFNYDEEEAKEIFDEDILKTLVELQYCLLHMNYLNSLCGEPFKPTKYHRTFNGTFIFKLLLDMKECSVTCFVEDLFEHAPSVLNFINMLVDNFKKQFW